jgi:uncharacterized membrane protein YbhN (UPF0104 family)
MNEARTAAANPRAMMKWLRIAFSAVALVWIFSRTPLHTVLSVLQSANPWLLSAGICLNVATRFAAAARTQVMNRALGVPVSRFQNIATLFISNFYALLSPGPWLSGVVTVYRYHHLGATLTGSVSSLLASRAVEALAFVFWGVMLALLDVHLNGAAARAPLLLGAALLGTAGICMALWWELHRRHRRRPPVPHASQPHDAWWTRTRHRIGGVIRQLLELGPRVALHAAFPATLQVFMSAAGLALLALATGVPLSWISAAWMACAVYAAVLLPVSVAGFGVREFTLINSFALLGFRADSAVAVSLLLFADMLVSGCIGALLQAATSLSRSRARALP